MEIERKFLIKDLHSLPFSIEAILTVNWSRPISVPDRSCGFVKMMNNIFSLINPKGL